MYLYNHGSLEYKVESYKLLYPLTVVFAFGKTKRCVSYSLIYIVTLLQLFEIKDNLNLQETFNIPNILILIIFVFKTD